MSDIKRTLDLITEYEQITEAPPVRPPIRGPEPHIKLTPGKSLSTVDLEPPTVPKAIADPSRIRDLRAQGLSPQKARLQAQQEADQQAARAAAQERESEFASAQSARVRQDGPSEKYSLGRETPGSYKWGSYQPKYNAQGEMVGKKYYHSLPLRSLGMALEYPKSAGAALIGGAAAGGAAGYGLGKGAEYMGIIPPGATGEWIQQNIIEPAAKKAVGAAASGIEAVTPQSQDVTTAQTAGSGTPSSSASSSASSPRANPEEEKRIWQLPSDELPSPTAQELGRELRPRLGPEIKESMAINKVLQNYKNYLSDL